jgi:glycerol kinase
VTSKFYLGVDQGTSGTTVLLLDENWNIKSKAYSEHRQIYPKPGWVEHDPMEIWEKTKGSIQCALKSGGVRTSQIRCLGIANQGETVMVWNKRTGIPVYNAIVWQDRRTSRLSDKLKAECGDMISGKTGLVVDAYFSALKIKWILDNVEGAEKAAEKGEILAGTLDSWLIWKLTGGKVHITDYSTASRTMLLNINTGKWDDEIINKIGIPKKMLPEIKDTCGHFGVTDSELFDGGIQICGSAVDQQAALFGQVCFHAGSVKTTYGTGCFMLMNTGKKIVRSPGGLLTTVAWGLNKEMTFALDGGIYIAGAAVQWLRDGIGLINAADETEAIAKSVPDTGGLVFVPAFVGLAAPHWDQYARGMMIGITGFTSRAHIVRAALESIAFQVNDNLDVMQKDSGIKVDIMRADGGAALNGFLMQFQADILGIPVDVPEINETTALGAAYMAALGFGDFTSLAEISKNWKLLKRYEPSMSRDQRDALVAVWKKGVERAKNWAEE